MSPHGHCKASLPRWNRQSGNVLVELAIILPLLIVLTLAVVEFASIVSDYRVIVNQTRSTARYLSQRVPGQDLDRAKCLALYGVDGTEPCTGTPLLPNLATATVTITDANNASASQFAQKVPITGGSISVNLVTVTVSGYRHDLATGSFLTGMFGGASSITLPPISVTMRQAL
jgi:Flp pilus assembly protein TadG